MIQSKATFNILLAISLGLLEVAIEIVETGYLMGKRPEHKWTYQRFQGFDKTTLIKKLESLSRQKIIEKIEDRYYLTKRGKARFAQLDLFFSPALPTGQDWAGIWYLVMFDIPEKYQKDRQRLRSILQASGLIRLQKSVYVYPHNIENAFVKISKFFSKYQLILVQSTSSIISDLAWLRFKKNGVIK